MFQYRITKYNPAHRNASGAYLLEEWTSYSDIGRSFNGVLLTAEVYQAVEDAYVAVAEAFLQAMSVAELAVIGLEARGEQPPVAEGQLLSVRQVGSTLRNVLREQFWCRFEGVDAFVHVGYDYYMYVGVAQECPQAEVFAMTHNLYVEKFASPYAQHAV